MFLDLRNAGETLLLLCLLAGAPRSRWAPSAAVPNVIYPLVCPGTGLRFLCLFAIRLTVGT